MLENFSSSYGLMVVKNHLCLCLRYVKVYLLDAEGQRLKKRKTSVKKSTINPQYGETFRYTLKEADLLSLTMQV